MVLFDTRVAITMGAPLNTGNHQHTIFIGVLTAIMSAGCGSAATTSPPAEDAGVIAALDASDTADAAAPTATAYPEGPYGTQVGAVLGDMEFGGHYRNETTGLATESPYETVKLADVRSKATTKYALIHMSAYWCGICKSALGKLVPAYPELASKATFVDIMVEGASPSEVSTTTQLTSWAKNLKIPYTTLRDPDGVSFRAKNDLAPRTMILVVELKTMTVLHRGTDVQAALDKVKSLD
jgi:hypothetical protein